jgi:hypothetical protein
MKPALHRCIVASSCRSAGFTIQQLLVLCALFFSLSVRAQFPPAQAGSARSISGQFIVIGSAENSPLANSRSVADDTNFVRLEPALLAVSAERIKESLWRGLGVKSGTPWRGQIFLTLHPAQSLDEEVEIVSKPSNGGWSYLVRLPDVLPRPRFMRAMTGVLLLEFANRGAQSHSAEIPAWLTDGLSEQLLAAGSQEIVLSSPDKIVNGVPVGRIDTIERGFDPLADARRVLKNSPALTFEQLSWPTAAQLDGGDGGMYRASAQLFVSEILKLKNGASDLRFMLETLAQFYNWQTAFQSAFRGNFPRPLDVEKWWALRVVGFVARDPGPQWTPAVSREKLDGILSVPVEFRASSNDLPAHAEISLQAVILNFDSTRQATILENKLRDLEMAQFRMAAPLAVLTDAYRRALSDYVGKDGGASPAANFRNKRTSSKKSNAGDTLKKLDALDAQRRTIESTIQPDKSLQPNLEPLKF